MEDTMLNEQEWNTINNILLELYTIDDIDMLSQKLMYVIRMLIPFTKGYFILLNEDQQIIPDRTYFLGMDTHAVEQYIYHYYDKDYLKYLYALCVETTVYKDSNILTDEIRKSTEFYQDFLQPADIPFGCGILIIQSHHIVGIFNLFRSEKLGDFTDKELYILNALKKHIENMIRKSSEFSRQNAAVDKCIVGASEKYALTNRESEILKLLSKGLSNNEICDRLFISLSTVKKHVYHLYTKTGVKSRTQLINLIYQQA
jgi:DNA-binding CsgD family transcriptional regulator